MKRSTAIWKMKKAASKWDLSLEFWQDVKDILKEFERDTRLDERQKIQNDE